MSVIFFFFFFFMYWRIWLCDQISTDETQTLYILTYNSQKYLLFWYLLCFSDCKVELFWIIFQLFV